MSQQDPSNHIVVLDFETYYSPTYSLSKMSTSEYIHSPQFETIGVAYKVGRQPTIWVPAPQVREVLTSLQLETKTVVAHNNMFDGGILSYVYGIRPQTLICTLSLARCLGLDFIAGGSLAALADFFRQTDPLMPVKGDEVVRALGKRFHDFSPSELHAYGEYCRTDVDITLRLLKHLAPHVPADEFQWQHTVLEMFTQPVFLFDDELLTEELQRVRERKEKLIWDLLQQLGAADPAQLQLQLASNPKFADLLRDQGIEPPLKTSKTTGKLTFAFAKSDPAMQKLAEHDDPVIQTLVAARTGTKSTIEESRIENFLRHSAWAWGIPYKVHGAHTGRLSGCLTGDTKVWVKRGTDEVLEVCIPEVRSDDLVWDGEDFVTHDGLVYRGFMEVTEHDGITGTLDHPVYTEGTAGTVALGTAKASRARIMEARKPPTWAVEHTE